MGDPTAGRLNGITAVPITYKGRSSPVNVYVIEDEPLTLVDTGPNLPDSLSQLESGLATLGYGVGDIERILITHPHIDHIGLAATVHTRSGAEVWVPVGSEHWISHYDASSAWIRGWREDLMREHGVPNDIISGSAQRSPFRVGRDPSVEVHRVLCDGDVVPFRDRTLTALSRSGHSPFDLLLHDTESGYAFVGDHLISHISSNALITPVPLSLPHSRPQALIDYRRSLAVTATLEVRVMLPGHGKLIVDHRALIERRLESMDRRAEAILAQLRFAEMTAYDVALNIWGARVSEEAWLTLSEVLGHVDLLLERGLVAEVATPAGTMLAATGAQNGALVSGP